MTGPDPWAALAAELDRWDGEGRTATFWWRDDDAVAATQALDRLLALREAVGVPLALAAIPAAAEDSLARRLEGTTDVAVVQHGYAHRNHAPAGAEKRELGPDRPIERIAGELATGWRRLVALIPAARPVMVPPWNRIDPAVAAALPGLGYRGLSTFKPRPLHAPVAGLVLANTHLDIVDWIGTRGFVGERAAVGAVVDHLAKRRRGAVDPAEPTGLLTHHLAHDEPCWAFVNQLVARSRAHAAARWIDADEAFGMGA